MTELELHLHSVCKKLRENNQKTSLIYVMLRTKDFKVFVLEHKLDFCTFSEIELIKYVKEMFNQMYTEGIIYRSAGIFAGNLTDNYDMQKSLFEKKENKKNSELSQIMDKLEDKFGKGSISVGNLGIKSVQYIHKRKMMEK